ncbi:polyprenyl synthetase family protein [Streptomyces sp. A012304]|uniref:polyprenyl synthetase family protein n=1 Tax=Streptomyces sp. A012304 TaxID=375446 RepID=UPI002230AC7D|nr:polyprenyl synthetase family protein [Streptomyces sp. A012304]GKQ37945.1 hypothetical protein ALMP_44800 [Streptomyces sp. A012304]
MPDEMSPLPCSGGVPARVVVQPRNPPGSTPGNAGLRAAAALDEGLARLYPPHPTATLGAELMGREERPSPPDTGGGHCDRRLHAALVAPVRHLLDAGGKRWRAHLMARVLEIFGVNPRRYAELLAACEAGHAGSLMVDDVEDASPLRRGSPAAHTLYGEGTAINAGTAAYFSLDRAVRRTLPDDAGLRLAVYETYLAGLRATHAGQALDIQGHAQEMELALATRDIGPLMRMLTLTHRLKTGAQVRAVCEIAALVARAEPDQRAALGDFGEELGLAYQIMDDVADLRGVTHHRKATKRAAEDLFNAKIGFPLAHAVTLLPHSRATALWGSLRERPDEPAVRRAARTIEDSGAVDLCEQEAIRLLTHGWTGLEPHLPDTPATTALVQAATAVVHRTWNA